MKKNLKFLFFIFLYFFIFACDLNSNSHSKHITILFYELSDKGIYYNTKKVYKTLDELKTESVQEKLVNMEPLNLEVFLKEETSDKLDNHFIKNSTIQFDGWYKQDDSKPIYEPYTKDKVENWYNYYVFAAYKKKI